MDSFLQQQKIVAILDASHPYAVKISQAAIAKATQFKIPYLRYERPAIASFGQALELDSFDTLLAGNYLQRQRVLLTLGYRTFNKPAI